MANDTESIVFSQARIRQQVEEQQQAIQDLIAWEDAIQNQKKNPNKGEEDKLFVQRMTQHKPRTKGHDLKIEKDNPTEKQTSAETNEDQMRIRGNDLYAQGQYDDAIRSYSQCISINPASAIAYSNRAMAYLKLKDWNHAEDDATRAIEIDPLHTKSYQRRSSARVALGKLRAAIQDLNMAEVAASKTGVTSATKEIATEKQRLQTLLADAMDKAPKRKVPIQFVPNPDRTNEACATKTVGASKPLMDDYNDGELRAIQTTRKNISREMHEPIDDTCDKTRIREEKEKGTIISPVFTNVNPMDVVSKTLQVTPPKKFRTWYEFEQVWKSYAGEQTHRILLLQGMKPQDITSLYKRNGMEDSVIFLDLIQCACKLDNRSSYISAISNIPSIDMVVMMLSKQEREILRKLLENATLSSTTMKEVFDRFGL